MYGQEIRARKTLKAICEEFPDRIGERNLTVGDKHCILGEMLDRMGILGTMNAAVPNCTCPMCVILGNQKAAGGASLVIQVLGGADVLTEEFQDMLYEFVHANDSGTPWGEIWTAYGLAA